MSTSNLSNLRTGHLNVGGLERHIDGVKLLLDSNQYHIFAVTETKYKPSSPIGPIRIPAYNFVRHSLPCGRGRGTKTCGGIGIYVRKGIKATPVLKSIFDPTTPIGLRIEFLAIQIRINDLNLGVVTFYNPLCSNPYFSQVYEKVLIDLLDYGFDRLFIVGDFNINVKSPHQTTNLAALNHINSTFNLTILPTGPTRVTENTSTTIDLLITDSPNSVIKSKTSTGNTISDHDVVYLLTNIRIQRSNPQIISVRNIHSINPLRLQADFQSKDLRPFFAAGDSTTKAEQLTSVLRELLQHHAPERNVTVRDKHTPWISEEIRRAVKLRNLAYTLYSRNPNRMRGDNQWQEYTRTRDRSNSLIFTAKKSYAELHFDHNLPAKKLWCNLRREGIHNNARNNTPVEEINAEELNNFFSVGHRQLQPAGHHRTPNEPSHRTAVDHGEPDFNFRHTNIDEICRKIHEIGTNATGSDEIPISFIKQLCPFILPALSHLFNSIIDTRSFPSNWKKALITPIPKLSNPTEPKDFRPISVLPALSKVLEKILLAQITDHLDNPNAPLLAKYQSGYRKGYSTTTALTKVVHDIYAGFGSNQCTVMVLVDFSLAFNCVDHRILETKLRDEFHFSQAACNLISSFLAHRKQSVRLGDRISSDRHVLDGTPQGSCLSALLFSLYINSLPLFLRCNYHLYADDLQVYVSGPAADIDVLVQYINDDLEAIATWARMNRLSPNPKKTQHGEPKFGSNAKTLVDLLN
ncbi:uncharacterized protein LOC131694845 [Topomyia yanbarensis]|uniref:uncharacterized protein LOC131694845 n=1 Tax=Topomyia yanbarensis TaxID=2498891 RepID=UPI00273AE4E8|nr:uncharacterized protein LOC131694845 [Topomyia yanbarensis]